MRFFDYTLTRGESEDEICGALPVSLYVDGVSVLLPRYFGLRIPTWGFTLQDRRVSLSHPCVLGRSSEFIPEC